jgi:mannitol-specific phosphotransferase system IIBC component
VPVFNPSEGQNAMTQPEAPRLIHRIGFGYALDFMPAALIVGFNQLRRKLERAGFSVVISLEPLSALPAGLDILFVPPELEATARAVAPQLPIVVVANFLNHPSYSELIRRLAEGREIYALPVEDERPASGAVVERYRGYERIE